MSVTQLRPSPVQEKPALDEKRAKPSSPVSRLADRLKHTDALEVVEAYEVQVVTRRTAYLATPLGTPARNKARRAWLDALLQLEAAEDTLALVIEEGGRHGSTRHVRHATSRATQGPRPPA